jgi:Rrf2 family protein
MISQTVEYSLRAIVTIAQHGGAPCTAAQISAITQVPGPFLSKMMQTLVRAELVTSKRGLHGGFMLTKDASELTILDVVDAIEPLKRIRSCPLGIASHGVMLCPLHRHLDNAMAMVEESFRGVTIAELLNEPGSVTPLCEARTLTTINLGGASNRPPRDLRAD